MGLGLGGFGLGLFRLGVRVGGGARPVTCMGLPPKVGPVMRQPLVAPRQPVRSRVGFW